MTLTLVAYVHIEPEGPTPQSQVQTVSPDIARYLDEHIDDLLRRARQGSTAPAFFQNARAKKRFTQLREGTEEDFLSAAQQLTDRLHNAMDRRANRGFLVLLRRSDTGGNQCAALKLDVGEKPAAAAKRTNGQLRLEAVKDLLDLPGTLQKGAVFLDPREASDVVVGERAIAETAQYFLRALEITQISRPAPATGFLIKTVARVAPQKADTVAKKVDSYVNPVKPIKIFEENPNLLSKDEVKKVLEELEQQPRPVQVVDPRAHATRAIVSVDGLTIRGSVQQMEKVTWKPTPDGWRIEIDVTQKPRKTYE